MEADNLRLELHDEIAHFVVERSAVGAQNSNVVIEPHLDVIGFQTSSPFHFASILTARLLMTEEIHIDWARCLSADDFQLSARLFHTQQRTMQANRVLQSQKQRRPYPKTPIQPSVPE
jgi:hypothetical protein